MTLMLDEDVTQYFDVKIKYKDELSINLMHDMFRKKFCDWDRILENRKSILVQALTEYKNKLQENVSLNNPDSADISRNIIEDLKTIEKVGNTMNLQKMKKGLNILHLSDIHMVSPDDPHSIVLDDILYKMITQISNDCKDKIDFICITGDIASSSNKNQYENFEKLFINRIKYLFEKDVNIFERILIVPGNHDIFRDFIDTDFHRNEWENDNDISNMMLSSKSMINENTGKMWNDKIIKKFDFYKNFEKKYISSELYEKCKTGFSYYKEYSINGINIGFTGLNSAWSYEKQSIKDEDKISVGYEQFNQISREYKSNFSKLDANMALIHHPCKLFEDKLSNSLLTNYNYILCGHTHKSDMESSRLRGHAEIINGGSVFYKGSDIYKQPYKFHIISLNKIISSDMNLMNNSITHYVWDDSENEWMKDISTTELKKGNGTIKSIYQL